jgi:hypothetical protein
LHVIYLILVTRQAKFLMAKKKLQIQGTRVLCHEAYFEYAAMTAKRSVTQKLEFLRSHQS